MSNGLKIVNELLKHMEEFSNKTGGKEPVVFISKTVLDEIQSDLQRLDVIDNANPSEALEYLDHIRKDDFNMIITTYPPIPAYNGITKDDMFNSVKQSLIKAEEMEKENDKLNGQMKYLTEVITEFQKILSIIKEIITKTEDKLQDILRCKDYDEYRELYWEKELTEEEFELLKRYFGNE